MGSAKYKEIEKTLKQLENEAERILKLPATPDQKGESVGKKGRFTIEVELNPTRLQEVLMEIKRQVEQDKFKIVHFKTEEI